MIISALRQTWESWAELGSGLHAEQWTRTTRLDGWNVKDVYAHCCWAPWFFGEAVQDGHAPTGPVTHARAPEVLAEMQASGGIAHTSADGIRQHAIDDAGKHSTTELTEQFRTAAPRVLQQLEALDPTRGVDYGGMAVVPLGEALRITLLEAVVHYLDIAAALDFPRPGPVAGSPLAQTVELLAEIADPVAFVDHATGRSTARVFPVLR
jgi:uncharacterized protein (TIGR03083 family)